MAKGVPTGTLVPTSTRNSLDRARLEDLDLDRPLLRLHHGDDVAALDRIARLDQPLDERSRFHVGAQRGHAELDERQGASP